MILRLSAEGSICRCSLIINELEFLVKSGRWTQ